MRLGNNQRLLLQKLHDLPRSDGATAAALSGGERLAPEAALACLRGMEQRGWVRREGSGERWTWTTDWFITTAGRQAATGTEQ